MNTYSHKITGTVAVCALALPAIADADALGSASEALPLVTVNDFLVAEADPPATEPEALPVPETRAEAAEIAHPVSQANTFVGVGTVIENGDAGVRFQAEHSKEGDWWGWTFDLSRVDTEAKIDGLGRKIDVTHWKWKAGFIFPFPSEEAHFSSARWAAIEVGMRLNELVANSVLATKDNGPYVASDYERWPTEWGGDFGFGLRFQYSFLSKNPGVDLEATALYAVVRHLQLFGNLEIIGSGLVEEARIGFGARMSF